MWPEEFEQALIMDSNATVLPAELDIDLKVSVHAQFVVYEPWPIAVSGKEQWDHYSMRYMKI